MTTELVLLVICCIAIVFLIVFRKTTFVKKYWKYALILIPAILILVLKIISTIRATSATTSNESDEIKDHVSEIKEKLQEVNTVVKIEAAVAKTENQQLMAELKDAQKIEDNRERRKRLAELMG